YMNTLVLSRDNWFESESIGNIANGLRLAADMLEGKPSDGRTFTGHNGQIVTAVWEAGRRAAHDDPSRARPLYKVVCCKGSTIQFNWALPTFSEFLSVYREQNPGTKVEDRALRRILKRFHIPTAPGKSGRPKK